MTLEQWKALIMLAHKSEKVLDLVARTLSAQSQAKQMLFDKGYGAPGTTWAEIVRKIPEITDRSSIH